MTTTAKKSKSLSWSEPAWSFRPRLKRELTRVLNFWMWVRILLVSLVLIVLLAYFVTHRFPDLEFNWTNAFLISIGLAIIQFPILFAFFWFVPPKIIINAKGVCRQTNHTIWRRRRDIQRIILDRTLPVNPRLCVGKSPASMRSTAAFRQKSASIR